MILTASTDFSTAHPALATLTPPQRRLLRALVVAGTNRASGLGAVVTKGDLVNAVRKGSIRTTSVTTRTVDSAAVFVRRAVREAGAGDIVNVWGVGYRYERPTGEES